MVWWLPVLAVVNTGILTLWYVLDKVCRQQDIIKRDSLPGGSGPTYLESEHNSKFPYDEI